MPYKPVIIIWEDITVYGEWKSIADDNVGKFKTLKAISIGFLIEETAKYYKIAQTVTSGFDVVTEFMIIPRGCVIKVYRLGTLIPGVLKALMKYCRKEKNAK